MDPLKSMYQMTHKMNKFEDLYNLLWRYHIDHKLERKHYHNISIGLFNIPCGGFGDIIVTKTFHDYLKQWYPSAKITICTTGPEKFKSLGLSTRNIVELKAIQVWDEEEGSECQSYDNLKFKKKPNKFDLMIAIPIINDPFEIKKFKKLVPYANVFNTFSVSEYNGEAPPYTFPIGVGRGQLGLLMNDFKIKQQNLIKKPYALVYIQPSPNWGVHSKYCFLSYLEMICKIYGKKHKKFQVVIPQWVEDEINSNKDFLNKLIKIASKAYEKISLQTNNTLIRTLHSGKLPKSEIIFRSDILPQKREIFISLMKDSVRDILVTGDQSLTDILSCCKRKRVWYQIAPWKHGLARNLEKHLPNKYYGSFKTSCGTIKTIDVDIDWRSFMKQYDFRIHGRKRMDAILVGNYHFKENKEFHKLLSIIEHSRYLETAQKKIKKLLNK